jgi:hypothetical protein
MRVLEPLCYASCSAIFGSVWIRTKRVFVAYNILRILVFIWSCTVRIKTGIFLWGGGWARGRDDGEGGGRGCSFEVDS